MNYSGIDVLFALLYCQKNVCF